MRLRAAAESIYTASLSSQMSLPMTPDTMNEAFVAGLRYNGRMSNVRRFFCLFATFDLLFTILMWFICLVVGFFSSYNL